MIKKIINGFLLCCIFGRITLAMQNAPTLEELCIAIAVGNSRWAIEKLNTYNININQTIAFYAFGPTKVIPNPDLYRFTFLHLACAASNIDVVEYLLNHNAYMNITDYYGFEPVHYIESPIILYKFVEKNFQIIYRRSTRTQETLLHILQRKLQEPMIQQDTNKFNNINSCIRDLQYFYVKYPENM